jgi:hypothetical protein
MSSLEKVSRIAFDGRWTRTNCKHAFHTAKATSSANEHCAYAYFLHQSAFRAMHGNFDCVEQSVALDRVFGYVCRNVHSPVVAFLAVALASAS